MKYRVVSDDLRGPARPPKPIEWPADLAKPIELLLEGKTLFVPDDDPTVDEASRYVGPTADEISRVYQQLARKAGRRLSKERRTHKGVAGWCLWLQPQGKRR